MVAIVPGPGFTFRKLFMKNSAGLAFFLANFTVNEGGPTMPNTTHIHRQDKGFLMLFQITGIMYTFSIGFEKSPLTPPAW